MKQAYRFNVMLLCALSLGALLWYAGCGSSGSTDQGYSYYNPGGGATPSPTSTVNPSGAITSITDTSGGTTYVAGQEIVIEGSGFGAAKALRGARDNGQSTVIFNPKSSGASPVEATDFELWSDNKIQCAIPSNAVVTDKYQVQVKVVNASGTTLITAPNEITILQMAAPQIISVAPGTVNQGGSITIHGDGFGAEIDDAYEPVQNGGYLEFGKAPNQVTQKTTTYWSRTQIVCDLPAGVSTGLVPFDVVTGDGRKAYYALNVSKPLEPSISIISPETLDTGATTPLTITGTNFGSTQGTGKVTFQPETGPAVSVTAVTSWNDRQLVCATPSSVTTTNGSVAVTVTISSGAASNSVTFSVKSVGSLLHGPRLGLITQQGAAISWDTRDAEIGEVKWGETAAYTGSLKETTATTRHRLTITGFSKAKTCHYAVVTGGKTMGDHTFTTAPEDGASTFTFVSMADNRGSSDQEDLKSITPGFTNLLKLILNLKPSFALHGGDLFYGSNLSAVVEPLYDTFKVGTDPTCGDISMLISPGNHEMRDIKDPLGQVVDPHVLFTQEFGQPNQLTGYEGTTFSFDWGNTHIASVDTCHNDKTTPNGGIGYLSDAQLTWLDADLKSAQAKKVRHIFVYGHVNIWRNSTLYDLMSVDATQCQKFITLLQKYSIDAYICGHEHQFTDQLGKDGLVQWLNGNSGSVATGKNQLTVWKVDGDNVEAQLTNEDGSTAYTRKFTSSQPK